MDCDVLIAGGGPAGAATAAALVRRGVRADRILIVDRARFPREKPCGGGLTGHIAHAMAALGLELTVENVACHDAVVRCGSIERPVRMPQPVRIIRREEFDRSLLEQVRELGVQVRQGCGLRDFATDPTGIVAETDAGAISARVLVGADGAGSIVRKRLRPRENRPIRLFRAEIPAPPSLSGSTTMVYDFTSMRPGPEGGLRGYFWIFPAPGDRINVGVMHDPGTSRSGADLTGLVGRELARYGIALPSPVRGWPAWSYDPDAPVAAPRVCLVGDAAGIDALTGEGIAVAMEQGIVAADEIARGLDRGDLAFGGYKRALRRATVGRELALDRVLARMLYRGRIERWLGLFLHDPEMPELYAARVSGALVLADHKRRLLRVLARHLVKGRSVCWS